MFHLIDSIDEENCCNQTQFLNKETVMKCLAVKLLV